jgi:putative photosynthetic complex assembly protein
MSELHNEVLIRKGQIVAAAALILFAFAATATARLTGIGISARPPAPVAMSREYRLEAAPNGSVLIYAKTGLQPIGRLGPEHHGFVRVVLKGLARERMIREIPEDAPIRLVELIDGRRLVEDPATGRTISLRAFGAGNAQAFTTLFALGSKHP